MLIGLSARPRLLAIQGHGIFPLWSVAALFIFSLCWGCVMPTFLAAGFGRTPIELCDKDTGEPIPEALMVPVYMSGSGIAMGEDPVTNVVTIYMAEPYIHESGRPFQSSQPAAGALIWIPPPLYVAVGMWAMERVIVVAPGYEPESQDPEILASQHGRKCREPGRIIIALARSPPSAAEDKLQRARQVLRGRQISQGEEVPFDLLEKRPVYIRFTPRERVAVEAFFERAANMTATDGPCQRAGQDVTGE
jgi:hypothetical protein